MCFSLSPMPRVILQGHLDVLTSRVVRMLEAIGTCMSLSPSKRIAAERAVRLKPFVQRLLEQANDVEANPGPLPSRLVRAHSGAQVRGWTGSRQSALEEVGRGSAEHLTKGETTLPGPHVARLLEQANDVESNPGPLPHRLVTRTPASGAQQQRGRVSDFLSLERFELHDLEPSRNNVEIER